MVHRIIREHREDDLAACAREQPTRIQVAIARFIRTPASNDPVIPAAGRDDSVRIATSGTIRERAHDASF